MRTQPSSLADFLEQPRKRMISHQERELQILAETAGIDRPNITNFQDSPFRNTHQTRRRRFSKVQVVIGSNASSLREPNSLQIIKDQPKDPPEAHQTNHEALSYLEEDSSKGFNTFDSENEVRSPEEANNNFVEAEDTTNAVLNSKKRNISLHWSLPLNWRKRRLRPIQKAATRRNLRFQAKPRDIDLDCSERPPPLSPQISIAASENEPTESNLSTQRSKTHPEAPAIVLNMSSQPEDHQISDLDSSPAPMSKYFPLTDECYHYQSKGDLPWDNQKYWHQRYSIFSLYDEGIQMTEDAWFGVTPEPVARQVASDLASNTPPSKTVVIDIFAGAGGNAIAFALSDRWETVIAIEKNKSVIACAQHNAEIYGVSDRITWIHDDSFSYLKENHSSIDSSKTVIFASPPWGGVNYSLDPVFNLKTMNPYSVKDIVAACTGMPSALFLPRTSDLKQIARLAPEGKKVEVVQYCMEGASKGLVAYIPAAV